MVSREGLPSREMHYWTCQKHDGIIPSIITNLIDEKSTAYKQMVTSQWRQW